LSETITEDLLMKTLNPSIQPVLSGAYELLHRGSLVMAEMEHNGLRVDLQYIEQIQQQIKKRLDHLATDLGRDPIFARWHQIFGDRTKLGSREQLAHVLFRDMKIPYPQASGTTRPDEEARWQMDEDILEDIHLPFVQKYVEMNKLLKAKNTYLRNIAWETVDGICHPNWNLHLARTYRGSSDHPNFTNIPMRDALFKRIIRRCFRARPGHVLVDLDFKGSEVNAASWYHKDPRVLQYIKTDPGRMHLDAAAQCYLLPVNEVTSEIRHCGKNMFVFPEFYGDWYISCARQLWKAIDRMHLRTKSGVPLRDWLRRQGIQKLGRCDPQQPPEPHTFEAIIKGVEYDFWHQRFRVYQQWKDDWWEAYRRQGYLQMLTGFVVRGYLNRKNAINYPVQGTAFHCLLWCLIRLQELLHKYKMKALLVGQIHDDAVADVPVRELKNYVELAQQVITIELKKHWPWIITPMRVEVETTPVGGTWYDKTEYKT